jgi:hypothetical protein
VPGLLSIPEDPFAYESSDISTTISHMNSQLASFGVSFEGRDVPFSTIATGVPADTLRFAAAGGAQIHAALELMLDKFGTEHRSGYFDGPLHRLFTPFYKWWDLIASEQRRIRPINLMRFDAIVDDEDGWSFVENNTACPGGVITCSQIRDSWLSSALAASELREQEYDSYAVDHQDGFVKVLDDLLAGTEESGSIALLNYRGAHTNELAELKTEFDRLKQSGDVSAEHMLLGDLRDLQCDGGEAFLDGVKVGLIYCKLPPFSLEPADPELQAWFNSLKSTQVQQVNSLGAMFLTEAKRSIAGLCEPQIQRELGLTSAMIDAIDSYYPRTWLASDQLAVHPENLAKDRYVLKADSLTRGKGVFVADSGTSDAEWTESIKEVVRLHGVVQEKCKIPQRKVPFLNAQGTLDIVTEHFGVDLFFFAGHFGGVVGRSHTDQIFNVGNGGRETPVIILKESHDRN